MHKGRMEAEEQAKKKRGETLRGSTRGRCSYVTGVLTTRKPRWSFDLLPHFWRGIRGGRSRGPGFTPAFPRDGLGWAIDSQR